MLSIFQREDWQVNKIVTEKNFKWWLPDDGQEIEICLKDSLTWLASITVPVKPNGDKVFEEKIIQSLTQLILHPCSVSVTVNGSERGYAFLAKDGIKVSIGSVKSLIDDIRSYYAED